MTLSRKSQINVENVTTLHIYNRTVRRAFLIGLRRMDGDEQEDTHRKEWIRNRLRELVQIFHIEVAGYAIMSNHYHLVVRTRPDLARKLTPYEVARRWWDLYPKKRDSRGRPKEPSGEDLDMILFDPESGSPDGRLNLLRRRLGDLSWFMKSLNEYISKRANREDGCTGAFWEGRFKSDVLEDQGAVLACMTYLDLNPIRAGLAETPESSDFTSGQDRTKVALSRRKLEGLKREFQAKKMRAERRRKLEEIEQEWNRTVDHVSWLNAMEQTSLLKASPEIGAILNIKEEDYLSILDWTGRQLRLDKKGKIPDDLKPILDRLDIRAENWVETIRHFDNWFYRFIGNLKSLAHAAQSRGLKWVAGIPGAKAAFKGT